MYTQSFFDEAYKRIVAKLVGNLPQLEKEMVQDEAEITALAQSHGIASLPPLSPDNEDFVNTLTFQPIAQSCVIMLLPADTGKKQKETWAEQLEAKYVQMTQQADFHKELGISPSDTLIALKIAHDVLREIGAPTNP